MERKWSTFGDCDFYDRDYRVGPLDPRRGRRGDRDYHGDFPSAHTNSRQTQWIPLQTLRPVDKPLGYPRPAPRPFEDPLQIRKQTLPKVAFGDAGNRAVDPLLRQQLQYQSLLLRQQQQEIQDLRSKMVIPVVAAGGTGPAEMVAGDVGPSILRRDGANCQPQRQQPPRRHRGHSETRSDDDEDHERTTTPERRRRRSSSASRWNLNKNNNNNKNYKRRNRRNRWRDFESNDDADDRRPLVDNANAEDGDVVVHGGAASGRRCRGACCCVAVGTIVFVVLFLLVGVPIFLLLYHDSESHNSVRR